MVEKERVEERLFCLFGLLETMTLKVMGMHKPNAYGGEWNRE